MDEDGIDIVKFKIDLMLLYNCFVVLLVLYCSDEIVICFCWWGLCLMFVRGYLCVGWLDIIYFLYKKLGMICYFGILFYEWKEYIFVFKYDIVYFYIVSYCLVLR